MTYSLTVFKNTFDNKTHRRMDFDTWSQFQSFLYNLSRRKLNGKRDAELISPAVYKPNTTRSNNSVLGWASWAAIDIDDFTFEGDLKDELYDRFGGYYYICYSTASSTADFPKFRLVLPLTREVEVGAIKRFQYALSHRFENLGDAQTKDFSRMYYVPADYSGAHNFIFHNIGDYIDPDALIAQFPYDDRRDSKNFIDRLPEEMRKQVIEFKKNRLDNNQVYWTSFHDCPFWPQNMAREYTTISDSGWYRQMYRIMVAIAGSAISKGYPINANEIVSLCREFDAATGNWYENRPMEVEANNALEYAYKNGSI